MTAYDTDIELEQLIGRVDLAIVTALVEELEPVLDLIGGRGRWRTFLIEGYLHYWAQFACGAHSLNVVACSQWKYGGNPTIAQVGRLKILRPRLIVMTGICAGWKAKDIELGDVIVAEQAFHVGEGKQSTTGFAPNIHTYQPPSWLLQWLKDFSHDRAWSSAIATSRPRSQQYQSEWLLCQLFERGQTFPETDVDRAEIQENCPDYARVRKLLQEKKQVTRAGKLTAQARKILQALPQQRPGRPAPIPDRAYPNVHYKAFASTAAVMAVEDAFEEPARHVRNVGAIDLEVASLLAVAAESGISAFAVKGVSDHGSPDKDDAFHAYAAEAAARWMYEFVCNYTDLLDQFLPKSLTSPSELISTPRPDAQLLQQATVRASAHDQLRGHVADFVGREQEIDQLIQSLSRSAFGNTGVAIGGIYGLGGIGKTELALVVAHRLQNIFPDARLLIELRGTSSEPLRPEQALQSIIRSFEPEAKLQEDLSQLQKIYWDKLASKRALIIADDAKNIGQIRPLLPPQGCALLITSRDHFLLPGMTGLKLGMLSQKDAENLLLSICSRIEKHAPKLAELCGYLPLALRVSASLLETNDIQDVSRYIEQLKVQRLQNLNDLDNPDDPQASVEASLQLSYEALKPAERLALCQLSVFPASFDLKSAQAVVGSEDVEKMLMLLRRRSLLEPADQAKRYSLHDLVRAFASNRLRGDEQDLVWQRYSEYYLAFAERAEPELAGPHQAPWMGLLDQEHDNLEATLRHMLDNNQPEISLRMAGALWRFWDGRGYLQKGRDWLDEALKQSEEMGANTSSLLALRAKALRGCGWLATQQGEFKTAQLLQQESLELSRKVDDHAGIAAAYNNLGAIAFHQGFYDQARTFCEESLALYKELGYQHGIATTLGSLGVVAEVQGNHRVAVTFYEQSLLLFHELEDRRNLALYLANLGNALLALGESARAMKCFEESLEIRQALGDRRGIANAYDNLGWFALGEQNDQQAAIHFAESLRVFQELGDREGIAWGLEGRAWVAAAQQRFAKAARLFGAAAALRELIQAPRSPDDQAALTRTLDSLRSQMSDDAFLAAWSSGQAQSLENSINEALDPAS